MKDARQMDYRNKTVLKSLQILEYFKKYSELELTQLVELADLPKSTLHRIVLTLESQGFLTRTHPASSKYQLGLTLLELGNMVAQRLEIRNVALPYMIKLRDQVNEAVNLIVRDQDEAVYIEKVDTSQPVRVYTRVGRRAPLYAGACPRILLSYLPEEEIDELLLRIELKKAGPGSTTDMDELRRWINTARANGYTVSIGELEMDSAAVAVPIWDYSGMVVAGLSIAGPTTRFSAETIERLVHAAMCSAEEISRRMGYTKKG
jgi:IclR family KDG regulon transcriptional repressor